LIQANPKNAEALNYLGYMLADRGVKLDQALDYIKRALELDPNNGAYLDSLGWVYFKLNDLELAQKFLAKALSRIKNDPTIYDHLGDLYFKMGEHSKAEEAWKKAISHSSEDEEIAKIKEKIKGIKKPLAKTN
jgi:tetratricopeptide (TPR) repeat protein